MDIVSRVMRVVYCDNIFGICVRVLQGICAGNLCIYLQVFHGNGCLREIYGAKICLLKFMCDNYGSVMCRTTVGFSNMVFLYIACHA